MFFVKRLKKLSGEAINAQNIIYLYSSLYYIVISVGML